jgi:hypothetical protein
MQIDLVLVRTQQFSKEAFSSRNALLVNRTAGHGFRTCQVDEQCVDLSNRHSGIRGKRVLLLSTFTKRAQGLSHEQFLDAIFQIEDQRATGC